MSNNIDPNWIEDLANLGFGIEDANDDEDKPDTGAYFEINVNNQTDEDGAPIESVDAEGEPTIDADDDMDIAEGEVDEAEQTVEGLEKTEETLENYEVALECAVYSNKGISAESLQFMVIGLEDRFNIDALYLPSTESFSAGRYNPSVEALRKIKKAVSSAKNAIASGVRRVIKKLSTWWKATVGQAIGMKKRADAIITAAKAAQGSPDQTTFELKGVGKICDERGQAFQPKDAIKKVDLLKDIADVVFNLDANTGDKWLEKADKGLDTFIKEMRESVSYMKGSTENFTWSIENDEVDADYVPSTKFERVWADVEKAVADKIQANKVFTKKANANDERFVGRDVKHTDVLPGGKMIYKANGVTDFAPSRTNKKSRRSVIKSHFAAHEIGVENFNPTKSKFSKRGTVNTLTQDECIKIAERTREIMLAIADSSASWEKRYEWFDTVDNRYKAKIKEVKNDEVLKQSSPHTKAVLAYINGIADMHRRRSRGSAEVAAYLVKTMKTMCFWCTRSLARYSQAVPTPHGTVNT